MIGSNTEMARPRAGPSPEQSSIEIPVLKGNSSHHPLKLVLVRIIEVIKPSKCDTHARVLKMKIKK